MFTQLQNSFVSGEVSPSLWGRVDLKQWHESASTMRNCFVNYRGGAASRAGLAYIGTCKQPGTSAPPRDINFQFNITQGYALEFGDFYMRIKYQGAYVLEQSIPITSVDATGLFTTSVNHGYSVGDWVYDTGNTGFSALAWIVNTTPAANTFTVTDLFGTVISSATASSGGTISRVYNVASPYAAVDLPYLKYTQSADTMTLTCVNTLTNTEYPQYDLKRSGQTSWAFTQETFASVISPPTNVAVTAQSSATANTWYGYVVTAVDSATGQESVASSPVSVENNNISIYAGSNTITWNAVAGASSYNVYKCEPSYNQGIPVGISYGYIGTSFGGSFTDGNILQDATTVPPTHQNPFARGQILQVNVTAGGTSYSQSTAGFTITTSTGTGFAGTPIIVSGVFVGFYITNSGSGYAAVDTIAITGSGGSGATASLTVGAQTGTYPGSVAYYQQRRVYASSLNNPDTYWMSKTGAYLNMDSSIPVIDNDAITGTPWAQQINGIQFMIPMPGGLVTFTGKGAWQVNGGNANAITPADQQATPQGSSGCIATVQPIPVNYNILYVQAKGATVRELEYNYFAQIYIGKDLTVLSNHLFYNQVITQWAYAEEPYKIIWCVRSDGTLLSFTYLKEQEIWGWARHDTNGIVVSVCTVTEPPVDAVYVIVKRYVRGQWMYYSERMDNRLWQNVEQCFCVDAGLSNSPATPSATLTASQSALGSGVTFTASSGVFNAGMVGNIIRMGGGKATVTAYTSPTVVVGTITQAITATVPNDPNLMPLPQSSGSWSIAAPITTITNLNHLEGLTVSILADGGVITPQVVTNGQIILPQAASLIVVGLPFTAQLQSMYLDPQGDRSTAQGKRKNIYAVSVRLENSRGISVGTNQPDASTQPNFATVPWSGLKEIKERNANIYAGTSIPLFTGDHYINVPADWATNGQVAIQQPYPLPMTVLALISYYQIGDSGG